MRIHSRRHAHAFGRWEDRVADADEPIECADLDVERIVREAMDAAQTAVECALAPLAELAAALPRVVDIEWSRGRRHRRRAARDWWAG